MPLTAEKGCCDVQPVKLFSSSYIPCKKTSDVPIILIHGFLATHRTWSKVKCKLGDLSKRTVIVYDLRNHGKSTFCDETIFDLESDIMDLKNLMETKKISRAILVGHSIASHIAVSFALRYENMVEMLIIVDMSLTMTENYISAFRNLASVLKIGSKMYKTFPASFTEEEAQNKLAKFALEMLPEISGDVANFPMRAPLHKDYKTNKVIWDLNTSVYLAMEKKDEIYPIDFKKNETYNGKVLFVYGEKSLMNPDHDMDLIKEKFPNSYFQIFKNGFHALQQEDPEQFLKIVGDFINSNNNSSKQ